MPIIHIMLVLMVVGLILWLITTYIPMDARIKQIMVVVVIILIVIWLVQVLLGGSLGDMRLGTVR